ncbi:STAS domain-containing protein [Dactylosporangium sp. CS-033363]|uniref:STAS domain-containing protein n=1 Tax=Dactylosporangium sp. CS-033363 TaxID=3239935 RepID=UPI003D9195CA
MLTLTGDTDGTTLTITANGDIDLSNNRRLAATVAEHESADLTTIVLDLAGVDFCDSAGLAAMVRLYRASALAHRTLVIRAPSENLTRLLEITGLDRVFTIEPAPA